MHADLYQSNPQQRDKAMNKRTWTRQGHRWLALLFTLSVVANFVAMLWGPPPAWITYSPLAPLALLMGTGLALYIQPHIKAWRQRARA